MRRESHEQNRRSWNLATRAHNSHKIDQAGFLKRGGTTLFPEEIELLGDLAGKRLAHLQCNSGQDTLSLAARGAHVTGVDVSDEAIAFAKQLSDESGIAAELVRADVYDWLEAERGRFDLVFASYGALCWLSDLTRWAKGVARVLAPGGRLVLVEFHPFALMFDEKFVLKFRYFDGKEPWVHADGVSDYVGRSDGTLAPSGFDKGAEEFVNAEAAHEFFWSLGEVVSALIGAGLTLEVLREWPFSNGARLFEEMRDLGGGRLGLPEGTPDLPLMYGLAARARARARGRY